MDANQVPEWDQVDEVNVDAFDIPGNRNKSLFDLEVLIDAAQGNCNIWGSNLIMASHHSLGMTEISIASPLYVYPHQLRQFPVVVNCYTARTVHVWISDQFDRIQPPLATAEMQFNHGITVVWVPFSKKVEGTISGKKLFVQAQTRMSGITRYIVSLPPIVHR